MDRHTHLLREALAWLEAGAISKAALLGVALAALEEAEPVRARWVALVQDRLASGDRRRLLATAADWCRSPGRRRWTGAGRTAWWPAWLAGR